MGRPDFISKEQMEHLYDGAYTYYQKEEYTNAETLFRFLTLLDPSGARFWIGLGASLQLQKRYEEALSCYAYSGTIESDNPYSTFYAYQCYSALDKKEEAQLALASASEKIADRPLYGDLRERIREARDGNH